MVSSSAWLLCKGPQLLSSAPSLIISSCGLPLLFTNQGVANRSQACFMVHCADIFVSLHHTLMIKYLMIVTATLDIFQNIMETP